MEIYLYHTWFLDTESTEVVKIHSHEKQEYPHFIVNNMAADVLAMQGARASAAMVLTWSWRNQGKSAGPK